ncbi:glycosyltransferase family 2 protein [Planotetraspora silvatica]|nr:glycosyltransferase family 2 protein [Planotetraspora silvatica]
MRMSVIIPAYNSQEKLDLTLAGLSEQTYPADLVEVIVVDNGSVPPLRLPEIRHPNTRLILCETPGRATARNTGLRAARGDVIHWLDSDVVLDRVAIEAHMRWHHLAPYLSVTSYLRFTTVPLPTPADVVTVRERAKLFEPTEPHAWIVKMVESTDGLRSAAQRAFGLHVGGSTSVNAKLIEAAGPMDENLFLGQDSEMGYRLSQAGAVFIPEPLSIGYHLGPTMRMRESESVNRASHAFLPDRVPHYRWLRPHPARQWLVPYVEVEVDTEGATYDDVRATVDAVLGGTLPDVSVVLPGSWDALEPERRAPLKDPHLDKVLIKGLYTHEPRVRLGGRAGLAPFVLRLPPGWVPGEDSVAALVEAAMTRSIGLVSVLLAETSDGVLAARLERTAAFARAEMVAGEDEDRDEVVDQVYGSMWVDAETYGIVPAADANPLVDGRTAYRVRRQTEEGGELERLTKEVERLQGKVTEWREESKRWRATAVQLRREVGTLRRQVSALKRGPLKRVARGSLRRLQGLLGDQTQRK